MKSNTHLVKATNGVGTSGRAIVAHSWMKGRWKFGMLRNRFSLRFEFDQWNLFCREEGGYLLALSFGEGNNFEMATKTSLPDCFPNALLLIIQSFIVDSSKKSRSGVLHLVIDERLLLLGSF